MSILMGSGRLHLDGKKELTAHNDFVHVEVDEVAIPVMAGNSRDLEVLVKPGDAVKVGTMIACRKDHFYIPLFSSVSGIVKEILVEPHSFLKPLQHIVISNDKAYDSVSLGTIDYKEATRDELVDFMMNAGIVGCGGAGFPSYIKYKSPKDIDVLIINAVECEPFITADARMIETHLEELITGVKAMLKMSTAPKAVIAIKKTKKALIRQIEQALLNESLISLAAVPDVYPMGWERTLILEITGKHYERLPAEAGVVLNNATTAIAFAQAMNGKPIVEKTVTVSGDGIARPANVVCRVGTSAKDIVKALGGYSAPEVLMIFGGPMMGKTTSSELTVVTPYSNAITLLKPVKRDTIPCLRCGRCNDHCPAGILPVRINEAFKAGDTWTLEKLNAGRCIQCGLCTYVCPSHIEVSDGVRQAKELLMRKG